MNIVDLALRKLQVDRRPGASGQDVWTREEFAMRYANDFHPGMTTVAVDGNYRHYLVANIDDIAQAWRNGQGLIEVLVMPDELWAELRPQLEVCELVVPA